MADKQKSPGMRKLVIYICELCHEMLYVEGVEKKKPS